MDIELSKNISFRNPLDAFEELISLKRWPCSRANEDELIAEIKSNLCPYRLYIAWSEEINTISLTITFDIKVPNSQRLKIFELLSLINENMWIGHFDITSKAGIPSYRYTYLIKNKDIECIKIFDDIVNIGVSQCEKYYPSFQMVLWEDCTPLKAANTCMMETQGSA